MSRHSPRSQRAREEARELLRPLILWMAEKDVLQVDVARGIGVSRGMVTHIFNGRRRITLDMAKSIEHFTRGKVKAAALLELESA